LLQTGFDTPVCGRLHLPDSGCEFGIQSVVETGSFGGRTGTSAVRLQRRDTELGHVHVGDDMPIPGNHAFVGASFRIGSIPGAERPYLQLSQVTPSDGTVMANTIDIRLSLDGRTLGIGVFRTNQERYGTWSAPVDRWFTTILEMDYGRTVPLRLWVYDDRDTLVDTVSLTADTTGGNRAQPRQTIGGTVSATGPVYQYADDWWVATANLGPTHVHTADLSLETSPHEAVPAGSDATMIFHVTNKGPEESTGTVLTLVPDNDALVVSVVADQGTCWGLRCDVGAVQAGSVAAITVTLHASAAGAMAVQGATAAATADPFPDDNEARTTLNVTEPRDADLETALAASPAIGSRFGVAASVTNHGPDQADAIELTISLPVGAHDIVIKSGDCSTSDSVDCTVASLPEGRTFTVRFEAGASGQQVSVRASVASATPDSVGTNDTADATTAIGQVEEADLGVTLSAGSAVVGASLPVTASLTNAGPLVTSARLTTPVPHGWTIGSVTPGSKCTASLPSVVCTWSQVVPGRTQTAVISLVPNAAGPATLSATVSGGLPDPEASNDDAILPVMVTAAGTVDLRLTGYAAPNPVSAGGNLTYSWQMSNAGTARATAVTFTHRIPAGTTLVSVKPATKCAAGATVTCSFQRLDPGLPVTVTEIVRPAWAGTLTTTAQVAASGPDGAPGDEAATLTTTVDPPAGITARLLSFPA
jgi:uncharacterized repeat protein (TIGR01451 family)